MSRILILDTYYPDFLKTVHIDESSTYDAELRRLMDYCFGTFDAYSKNLRSIGWDAVDAVVNCRQLQKLWARENGFDTNASLAAIALEQIRKFEPQVIFFQDLNIFDAATLRHLSERGYTLASQCSCPLPKPEIFTRYDVIFSSLPKHVEHFKSFGVRAEYLPLAFEHTLLDRIPPQERDIDVSFVGGLGASLHWKAGTHAFERLAEAIGPRFQWYGYGLDRLDKNSPLRECYRGEAFGLEMYRIYGRSRVVVNRHGEIAQGYANNLRIYEATGMGACLVTERASNINPDMRASIKLYTDDLPRVVQSALQQDKELLTAQCGRFSQAFTLRTSTYAHRMPVVAEVLTECLKQAA